MRMVLLFAVLCVIARSASAESNSGFSVEWLAHKSDVIVVATPIKTETIKGPGDVRVTKTRFLLEEVIKGPLSAGDCISIYDRSRRRGDDPDLTTTKENHEALLIFAKVGRHTYDQIGGKYRFTRTRRYKSAYSSSQPVANLFTPDFKLVSDYEDLLSRAKNQAKYEFNLKASYWKGTITRKSLEVPDDTEAHRHLYSGSVCYVWIPEYKESETRNNSELP